MSWVSARLCLRQLVWIITLNLMIVMVASTSSTTSKSMSASSNTSESTWLSSNTSESTSASSNTSESTWVPSNTSEATWLSSNTSESTSASSNTSESTWVPSNTSESTSFINSTLTSHMPSKSETAKVTTTISSSSSSDRVALSKEGQLGIIITCVLVGTGLLIAAVAFITRYFHKKKTLTYEQRTNVPNGYIGRPSPIEEGGSHEMNHLRENTSSASLTTHQSV